MAENSLFCSLVYKWMSIACYLLCWFLENWEHIPFSWILNLCQMQSTTWTRFQNKRSSSSKSRYIWQKIASFEGLLKGEGQLSVNCSFDFWKIENTYLCICFQFSTCGTHIQSLIRTAERRVKRKAAAAQNVALFSRN